MLQYQSSASHQRHSYFTSYCFVIVFNQRHSPSPVVQSKNKYLNWFRLSTFIKENYDEDGDDLLILREVLTIRTTL